MEKRITALAVLGGNQQQKTSDKSISVTLNSIRPTIVCGLNITSGKSHHHSSFVETLNDQNKYDQSSNNIMDVDEPCSYFPDFSCIYLVVYDFQYTKEPLEGENAVSSKNNEIATKRNETSALSDYMSLSAINEAENVLNDNQMEITSSHSDDIVFLSDMKSYDILKKEMTIYQNLIPGESDEIFLPPPMCGTKQHSGPRALHLETTETDAAQASSLIIQPDYSFMNGQLGSSPLQSIVNSEKSISDHISEMKSSNSKKLNYSRAVQCLTLPEGFKGRKDLEVLNILPTNDGCHLLVVLKSISNVNSSVLIVYSLNFSSKLVRVNEEPKLVRELNRSEQPVEVTLLPHLDRLNGTNIIGPTKSDCDGFAAVVCQDGAIRIVELATLRTISLAKLEGAKFVSAVYCNSKLLFLPIS